MPDSGSATLFIIFFFIQVEYSGKMEPYSLKILLKRLRKAGIDLRLLTTDRSSQIKSLMKEINELRAIAGLPAIKHCFDIWHMTKSVTKDLFLAAKLKRCQTLGVWIKSIRNMYYHCFKNCKGDPLLLREMILSIPGHVSGVHHFPDNKLYKRCLHPELPSVRSKPWLKEGSLSMKKLVKAIRGHRDSRLKDLECMTEFQHTGPNEWINALHNMYFPKSTSFGPTQSQVRACLTVIDHNKNADRETVLDHDGNKKYIMVVTRDGVEYKEKEVKVPKDTSWRKEICDEVLQAVRSQQMPSVKVPTDEHLKLYKKKRTKPVKSIAVPATKKRRRL